MKQNIISLNDLAKRSRYYQSMIDASLLKPGIPDYNILNSSYVILIAPFDLFGYGRYVYTFRAVCQEEPDCILPDGAIRIFLNLRGHNDSEVSPELVSFLHYLEHTTDEEASGIKSDRIARIHKRVKQVRLSGEIGVKYMQSWEEQYYYRKDGGRILLLSQIRKKLAKRLTYAEIADALEEPEDQIRYMAKLIETHPEMDDVEILEKILWMPPVEV